MPFALRIPGRLGNVGEGSIAVVVIQNVLAALQSRRPARDHHAFVEARTGFGHGRGRQIEIDVVGDEQIEVAVAIVVDEGAAGIPARAFARHASLLADVGESAVAVVVIQNVLAEVGDEQIVPSVVVVVADANTLSPARVRDSGLRSDVGESAIAIVLEKMRSRLAARGKAFQARAVHQKNVEPSIVVVVVEGNAATGGFEQVFVLVLAAENGLRVQSRFATDVDKANAEISARRSRFVFCGLSAVGLNSRAASADGPRPARFPARAPVPNG